MKTNQLMKREFLGSAISQRTKDGFFNATELLAIYETTGGPGKRIPDFLRLNGTEAFLVELQAEIANVGDVQHSKTYEATRGKGGGTWMHPYLFVKFAMHLSPKFELQIIKWVYDNLIDFRNQAGDHFKEMCLTISDCYEQYYRGQKASPLVYQREIKFLNSLVYGSFDGGKRNELTEQELALLNQLQKLNIGLIASRQYSVTERRQKLADHAQNFKMIIA